MSDFFPQWMPLWLQLLVVVAGAVYGLFLLMVPFAVFGVKGRLREIELQQQELQADLRAVSLHLASFRGQGGFRVSEHSSPTGPEEKKASSDVVVEEIHFSGSSSPEIPEASVVMPSVRAPRVSDAYEPRYDAPPLPHEDSASRARSARIMPWHTQKPSAGGSDLVDERAPDANKVPHKPDFSREHEKGSRGRSEPVLNWPSSDA